MRRSSHQNLSRKGNNQSWTKNKAKKGQKAQEAKPKGEPRGKGKAIATNKREKEDEHADTSTKKDQSHNRQCIELTRRLANDSCQIVSSTKRRHVAPFTCSTDEPSKPEPDLRDQLNTMKTAEPESPQLLSINLREKLNARIDDLQNDPHIIFSADDTIGVHSPHNDSLLVELGIGSCDVTKVLIDTCSSVDLIFRDTLDKMGIDLCNMKPSTRSLTGLNGSSETMLRTICLPVYACGVTRTIEFSVISTTTHYNVILGTPWIHSMKAVTSTYHQCVKFPNPEGKIQTLRKDQQAARDLLIATVKFQQAAAHVNAIAKPIRQIYPQKDEIVKVPIDRADPSRVVRV
ncbi:hypothetical protein N665_0047s0029 [Sinapis alba]|nr:hypothetical protein N665_0047s0029 [Sinapis alba]